MLSQYLYKDVRISFKHGSSVIQLNSSEKPRAFFYVSQLKSKIRVFNGISKPLTLIAMFDIEIQKSKKPFGPIFRPSSTKKFDTIEIAYHI